MVYALESKKNDCKNCYKCIRGCPTKSISFSNNQASIIHDDCILCGRCFLACPQEAKQIRNDTELVKNLIKSNSKVIVSMAPAFIGNYKDVSFDTMKKALKQLGFYNAEETAIGATIVKKAYDEILSHDDRDVVISTCCHAVNLLVQKHFPDLVGCLADVLSPMLAHGKDIKERYPGAKVVFIGPCIAKKDEVDNDQNHYVDACLTFIELDNWLKEQNIVLEKEQNIAKIEESKARLFPIAGGILKTMSCSNKNYDYLVVDGIYNCISALKDIKNGNIHKCFIEMSSCPGSCINGPATSIDKHTFIEGYIAVSHNAGNKDFSVSEMTYSEIHHPFHKINLVHAEPSEEDIEKALKEMGKTSKDKQLNCGSCGYNTCRDKACAIIEGKAVKEMCLPYLMEKAQSFSNNIVYNTPNGLMVLDENLNIQLMNKAMLSLLEIKSKEYIIGKSVTTILEPDLYALSLSGETIKAKKQYLAEYDKYVEETIIHDSKFHIIISIMRDITEEQKAVIKRNELFKKSVDITNNVIEKNMRTVQEIASLLGESAAETKVALSSLKDTFENDSK